MRVVLIRPPTFTSQNAVGQDAAPPLGVAYLASVVQEAGYQVEVIDAVGEGLNQYALAEGFPDAIHHGLGNEEIIARIPDDVDLIGISCMFSLEWPFTRTLINMIKTAFPEPPLIAGGEHITALAEFVLNDCAAIDVCALGEGDETLLDLINTYENGGNLEEVAGIAYRREGVPTLTPNRGRIRAVDDLPNPAWDLVPIEMYLAYGVTTGVNLGRSMPIMASRGCPYECTFCSNPVMWGRLWRARTPQHVIEEMMEYIDKYQVTNFDFYDLTAIVRKEWIIEFTTLVIEKNLDITWQLPSGTRSEALDSEVTDLLYKAGCRYLNYAPESGSEEMLELIKKRISKDRMLDSMKRAVKNGLKIKANLILGFPDETYQHVWETYGFIVQMAIVGIHDLSVFPFSPYPGSALFQVVLDEGAIKLDDEYFYSLAQYTDATITRSYSHHIGDRALGWLTLLGMALFYFIRFLLHPMQLFQLIVELYQGKPTSKLGTSLDRVLKKQKTRRQAKSILTGIHN